MRTEMNRRQFVETLGAGAATLVAREALSHAKAPGSSGPTIVPARVNPVRRQLRRLRAATALS